MIARAMERNEAVQRTRMLVLGDPRLGEAAELRDLEEQSFDAGAAQGITRWLREADLPPRPQVFLLISFCSAMGFVYAGSFVLSRYFLPLLFAAGAALPFSCSGSFS